MEYNNDICQTGIQFFGKITASISHEAKNCLAIINENAGLLQDFIYMAEKGTPLDPERLNTLAGKIMNQISRSDQIFKNMNRFAHSSDKEINQEDLGELIDLIVTLSTRIASTKNTSLTFIKPEKNVKVTTSPFLLEALVFSCLTHMLNCLNGQNIEIVLEKNPTGASIIYKGSVDFSVEFPTKKENDLINLLKGKIIMDEKLSQIIINLPENIEN